MVDIDELLDRKDDLKESLVEATINLKNRKKELSEIEKEVKAKFGTTNPVLLKKKLAILKKNISVIAKSLENNEIYQNQ